MSCRALIVFVTLVIAGCFLHVVDAVATSMTAGTHGRQGAHHRLTRSSASGKGDGDGDGEGDDTPQCCWKHTLPKDQEGTSAQLSGSTYQDGVSGLIETDCERSGFGADVGAMCCDSTSKAVRTIVDMTLGTSLDVGEATMAILLGGGVQTTLDRASVITHRFNKYKVCGAGRVPGKPQDNCCWKDFADPIKKSGFNEFFSCDTDYKKVGVSCYKCPSDDYELVTSGIPTCVLKCSSATNMPYPSQSESSGSHERMCCKDQVTYAQAAVEMTADAMEAVSHMGSRRGSSRTQSMFSKVHARKDRGSDAFDLQRCLGGSIAPARDDTYYGSTGCCYKESYVATSKRRCNTSGGKWKNVGGVCWSVCQGASGTHRAEVDYAAMCCQDQNSAEKTGIAQGSVPLNVAISILTVGLAAAGATASTLDAFSSPICQSDSSTAPAPGCCKRSVLKPVGRKATGHHCPRAFPEEIGGLCYKRCPRSHPHRWARSCYKKKHNDFVALFVAFDPNAMFTQFDTRVPSLCESGWSYQSNSMVCTPDCPRGYDRVSTTGLCVQRCRTQEYPFPNKSSFIQTMDALRTSRICCDSEPTYARYMVRITSSGLQTAQGAISSVLNPFSTVRTVKGAIEDAVTGEGRKKLQRLQNMVAPDLPMCEGVKTAPTGFALVDDDDDE
eukprot:GFYU01017111.1.p1 GENE.GFYU01017111.1~~GFYU01017111.1.p1  ORF type:complete len:688 (-),score=133.62 GFYU01017111.1:35-2038(-)